MPYFLGAFFSFWFSGVIFLVLWGYRKSFLMLNTLNVSWLDSIMPHYTHLGDGVTISVIFMLIVLPRHKAVALSMLISLILVSLSIFLLKSYVFPDWDRPLRVFDSVQPFHYISLDRLTRHSFPSGHSAAAAAMFTIIAFYLEKGRWYRGILLSMLAVSISYSRLYIGVHFLGDILAGTLLGLGLAMLVLAWMHPGFTRYFSHLNEQGHRWWSWGLYLLGAIAILINVKNFYQIYING